MKACWMWIPVVLLLSFVTALAQTPKSDYEQSKDQAAKEAPSKKEQ